jgi:hypothetical protein
MAHAGDTSPPGGCARLLLVAARCTPGVAKLYLADPDLRPGDVARRGLRQRTDGHTPTRLATTSAQLTWMLWAAVARMAGRYLAALLVSVVVRPDRPVRSGLAGRLVSLVRRRLVLLAISKQLLPTPTWPRPLAGLVGRPVAALALYGPTVGIRLLLMTPPDGPDVSVELGRAGHALQEVDLEPAMANGATGAGSSA